LFEEGTVEVTNLETGEVTTRDLKTFDVIYSSLIKTESIDHATGASQKDTI
jgi:hypothetical protein